MSGTGTISFDGLATGINATETVDKLIEVESRPRILKEAEKTRYENEAAAWRDINTKLLSLRDMEKNLWRSSTWNTLKIASTNSGVLTATATSAAKEGTNTLSVEQLALNGQKVSQSYAATSSLVGAGTLTLSVGSGNASIDVTDTDTLSTLADKINSAGLDVSASLVKDGTEYRLLISADKTGVENDVILGGDVATSLNLTTIQAAQDAKVKFGTDSIANGSTAMTFTSASNKVTGIIDGVTLNLTSASPGESITLTTSRDNSSIKDEIQKYIDAYNDVISSINKLTAYDEEKKIRGVLQADSTVKTIGSRLRQIMAGSGSAAGTFKTLRSIGIELQDDGTLKADTEKLDSALAEDYEAVEDLFRSSGTGYMGRLDEYLKDITSPIVGLTDRKIATLDSTVQKTQDRIDEMNERLKAKRDMLMSKFVQMESVVKSFNTQSSFLTSQLSGINKNWG